MLRSRIDGRLVTSKGLEHLPAKGAFVFAANHYYAGSTLDVIASVLGAAARVRPGIDGECAVVIGQRAMPRRRWFSRPLRWMARLVFERWRKNFLRIRASAAAPTGIAELREWRLRARTQPTLVFPEGAANNVLGELRPGAGSWLAGLQIPVIPVGVWWNEGAWNVVFGAPIVWAARRDLRDLQLGLAMAKLLPPLLVPAWSEDLDRWHAAHGRECAVTGKVRGPAGVGEREVLMRKLAVTVIVVLGLAASFAVTAPEVRAGDYGKCNFDSECHAGAKCNSSKCSDAPGGKCNFDSECNGKKCNSGTCK